MHYTAIMFAVNYSGACESLVMYRSVQTDDLAKIYEYLIKETRVSPDNIDTILLLQNGKSPEVFRHWSVINGDFQGLKSGCNGK